MPAPNTKPIYFTKGRITWFVAFVAVWLFAILIPIEWVHKSGNQIELSHGQVCVTQWIVKEYIPPTGLHRTDRPSRSVLWLHDYAHTQYLRLLAIPLWPLALMPAIPMGVAWFKSNRVASRLHSGFCPRCGYSRSGLPAEAPCPECNYSRPTKRCHLHYESGRAADQRDEYPSPLPNPDLSAAAERPKSANGS